MSQDSYGLRKDERLAAERETQAKADEPQPLDPPFPFTVLPFPIALIDPKTQPQ